MQQALMIVLDRHKDECISYICANERATAVRPGLPFPPGSVLIFESWTAKRDAAGALVHDADGNLLKERLNGIHVLHKHAAGSGTPGAIAPGWEFRTYRPEDPSGPLSEVVLTGP